MQARPRPRPIQARPMHGRPAFSPTSARWDESAAPARRGAAARAVARSGKARRSRRPIAVLGLAGLIVVGGALLFASRPAQPAAAPPSTGVPASALPGAGGPPSGIPGGMPGGVPGGMPGGVPGGVGAPASQPPFASPRVPDGASPPPGAFGPPAPSTLTTLEPEQLTGYAWPVRTGRMTGFYDYRESGFLIVEGGRIHEGLDIATFCGDKVFAAHAGTVLHAGRRFGPHVGFEGSLDAFYARLERRGTLRRLPIVVVIDDGNGYRSSYVHLSAARVKAGDRIEAGQLIGLQGATGNASGCHLHYELIRMDGQLMRVAPQLVKESFYPPYVRERIDPLRVLSLDLPWAPRFVPGIRPPRVPPGSRPDATAPIP